jgi:predicted nucleic-acid-binding protein
MEQIGRPLQKGLDSIRATRPAQDPGLSTASRLDPVGNCLECRKSLAIKDDIHRIVTNDDLDQTRRTVALFERERTFIAKTVLLETERVLRFSDQLSREVIIRTLRNVIGLKQVEVENPDDVTVALDWRDQGMDFADALHFASVDEKRVKRARTLQALDVVAV